LSGLIFAAIAEGMQSMITQNRETDYFDYLANSIGILSATTIIAVFQPKIRIISNFFFARKWRK
jgi:hypothetical protein